MELSSIQEDGNKFFISQKEGFDILGDAELFGQSKALFWQEACTDVDCLEITLSSYRDILLKDNRFLRFLLYRITNLLEDWFEINRINRLDQRFQYYLERKCKGGIFDNINAAVIRLNCSHRQLHRLINKFEQSGILVKIGRGKYQVREDAILLQNN